MSPRAPRNRAARITRAALLCLLLASAPAHAVPYSELETRDLRLGYYKPIFGFIAPYTTQCFENSLRFYRKRLDYVPSERVNMFLEDTGDYGNAGVWGAPRSSMSVQLAPMSFAYETGPSNERINFLMNHEMAHVVTLDVGAGRDLFFRRLFQGKVRETSDHPETILYGFLTLPRRAAPRWHREGTAVFFETWMSGGYGRAQGPYDEMVWRSMVRDSAHFYDPLGLETEGVKVDFQVGVNSYLYGTRFMSYLAWQHTPDSLVQWVSRRPGSKAYFASQFKHVFGMPMNQAWHDWVRWEHGFQQANLDSVHRFPTTPYRDLSKSALGSVSRAYLDSASRVIYAGVYYPGKLPYVAAIPLDGGPIRELHEVKGPALYTVCSLAWDPDSRMLFYTTDNNDWRDLCMLDPATGRSTRLMRDGRVGDLAFNRQDRSLWGVRHFNGMSTLVRFPYPYRDYKRVFTFPWGQDLYDIDISPDGTRLVGSLTQISGKQSLRLLSVPALMKGDTTSRQLYDFGVSIPNGFVFSPDGRFLYGSSYYTGVSNIWRYDLAADSMDIVTNAETGFFRPLPAGGDSLVVFRYSGKGFTPAAIEARPLTDVSAITFLGAQLVKKYPELKTWKVPSPRSVNVDSATTYSGTYRATRLIGLANVYPVVEGYKVYAGPGVHVDVSDPFSFHNFEVTATYTPVEALPSAERWHVAAGYRHFGWSARYKFNRASFYDLFGPTKTSMKGHEAGLAYNRSLLRDAPRQMDLKLDLASYTGLERLPDYQNVSTSPGFDQLYNGSLSVHYKHFRSSIGSADTEKGHQWELGAQQQLVRFLRADQATFRGYPQFYGSLDLGIPLPLRNSSLWLRGAGGYSPGDPQQPFANFYFGGFGNNWVDFRDPKRYREWSRFPGIEIDEVGGTDFTRMMAEWNLPALRFERLGTLDFFASWARLSVYSTGLVTNLGRDAERRKLANAGLQTDVRFQLLIHQPLTLSFGYARAFERHRRYGDEWMLSLKIL